MATYEEIGKMIKVCPRCERNLEGKLLLFTEDRGFSMPAIITAMCTAGISLLFWGIKQKERYKKFKCPKCSEVTSV